jgi:hypothetical protein
MAACVFFGTGLVSHFCLMILRFTLPALVELLFLLRGQSLMTRKTTGGEAFRMLRRNGKTLSCLYYRIFSMAIDSILVGPLKVKRNCPCSELIFTVGARIYGESLLFHLSNDLVSVSVGFFLARDNEIHSCCASIDASYSPHENLRLWDSSLALEEAAPEVCKSY